MSLEQRLAAAAHHVAEHVDPPEVDLDAIRSRAHTSRRRTAAVGLLAATVTAVAIGIPLLAGRDSAAPRPATTSPSGIIATLRDSNCGVNLCLPPGTYRVELGQGVGGQPLSARLTVPTGGWESNGFQHRISRWSEEGTVVLNVYRPHTLVGPEPCEEATARLAPDAGVDDVVRLLTALPQLAVAQAPTAVPAFGHETVHVQVRADRIVCRPSVPGAQYNLADIYGGPGLEQGGDSDIDPEQAVLIDFWVLDLDGRPIVVEARQEGSPGPALTQRLVQVREALTFVRG